MYRYAKFKIKKHQALYLSRYSSVDVDVGTVCLYNVRVYWLIDWLLFNVKWTIIFMNRIYLVKIMLVKRINKCLFCNKEMVDTDEIKSCQLVPRTILTICITLPYQNIYLQIHPSATFIFNIIYCSLACWRHKYSRNTTDLPFNNNLLIITTFSTTTCTRYHTFCGKYNKAKY